ncbi:mitogen-activated protein kinase kinase kinase 1-like [Impatiens glandulifera]|uniref:mitogen-activated protein kinase kinase kinase 1-like n=1 Tax=Impatiens glandulifera TaxID=253017 RepID=UPI001FB18ECD|nr:mitogen-activated protein kinase kinase kinase 1-like [Impatiens glandulifera]XP_047334334.1 mitogen-activated protein kinase kinase kinase 1-like [Impatiens glandulifera]
MMSEKQSKTLRRSNALKDIYYEDSPSSLTSSFDDRFRRVTGVPDLYSNVDRNSFRIEGVEGEFDRICQSLGLSGPEDFAIPPADWEACKARSSSDHYPSPSPRFQLLQGIGDKESAEQGLSGASEARLSITHGEYVHEIERSESSCSGTSLVVSDSKLDQIREVDMLSTEVTISRNPMSVRSHRNSRNSIKGDRPPELAPPPPPPPVILLSARDKLSSSWDNIKSFAPEVDEDMSSSSVRLDEVRRVNSYDEQPDRQVIDEHAAEITLVRQNIASSVPECCSDSSKEDNDNDENENVSFHMISKPVYYYNSPNRKFKPSITTWQKGEFLGSGSFGTVYEGFTEDGFFFAVKEVSLLDQGSQGKQSIYQLEQEILLLSQFKHENIVQYLGTYKDDSKLYIFLELVTKGSLGRLYQKYDLRDSQVSAYTRQILSGLNYLHQRNVIHRDIKSANILVDASGAVKLADFGLAKATKLNDVKSCKGTVFWMAPEVVNRRNTGYGLAADIWSLGCTVLEMLTRQIPYSHLEGMQALFRIGKGELPLIPSSLSNDAQDFIGKCLQVNPDHRPTASQLMDHPFIKRSRSNSDSASPHHNRTKS